MKRLKVLIVAAIFAVVPFVGTQHASAMTCAPDLEDACRVVATVVCGIVAKGKPCLA